MSLFWSGFFYGVSPAMERKRINRFLGFRLVVMKAMAFHQVFFFHGDLYIPMEEGWFFGFIGKRGSVCAFGRDRHVTSALLLLLFLVSNIYHLLNSRNQIDAGVDQLLSSLLFKSFRHLNSRLGVFSRTVVNLLTCLQHDIIDSLRVLIAIVGKNTP